jgi:hypothetical protein
MNTMKSPTTSTNVKNDQSFANKRMDQYRGLLRVSALWALIAGALLSFPLLSASAQTSTDQIRLNRDIGKCWHKKDPWMDNGNIIHLWDCEGGPMVNRAFFYDSSTGFIRSSINPSKCIHKKNPGWKLGDTVHLWDCAAGEDENKIFDYDDNDGRVLFRSNPEFCAGVKFLGKDNGNPIVVKQCKFAESYSISRPRSASTPVQGSVPCSNVRLASETLILEVKTGNPQGAGSSATIKIRIVFDDWDTGVFTLNSDRSFFADGMDVINTGIQIPGGCNRKGTNMKSMVIENTGSSGIFSADAWFLESICARSSTESFCGDPLTINRWINGGGRVTWGLK